MKSFVVLLILSLGMTAHAMDSIFIDPKDHYLDASEWLLKHRGFLPVPIIITEPAVGYGGGVALVFMSENEDSKTDTTRFIAPTVTGVLGAATENGTRAAGAFYVRNWDHDRWRYMGFVADVSANLDFYGLSGFTSSKDIHFAYNIKGWGVFNDLRTRIADSNFFFGGRYIYTDINVNFDDGILPPTLRPDEIQNRNGGLSFLLSYDSRTNPLSPQAGFLGEYRYYIFREGLGGDLNYNVQELDMQGFIPVSDIWAFAARLQNKWVDGETPFYAKPFINLRGIAKLRYQGEVASSFEAEVRYNAHPRWQLSLFGGVGRAGDSFKELEEAETASAYGVGFRYLIARLLGFQMGLDIARGPEETVFYIQAGNAWIM
ncbi:BamA/TamA family outer membrane protein [Bdellovibrio sp. NC01]|uniref:BamA/TamA family outer membrane protein n=1 Tax=Bdellovibrio sp. NC01 TaxID=2220073 RepID=UPI00143CF631|nr:BamA/TamA family outer membrane protein [Bdellovibrio sp. NC01]